MLCPPFSTVHVSARIRTSTARETESPDPRDWKPVGAEGRMETRWSLALLFLLI